MEQVPKADKMHADCQDLVSLELQVNWLLRYQVVPNPQEQQMILSECRGTCTFLRSLRTVCNVIWRLHYDRSISEDIMDSFPVVHKAGSREPYTQYVFSYVIT